MIRHSGKKHPLIMLFAPLLPTHRGADKTALCNYCSKCPINMFPIFKSLVTFFKMKINALEHLFLLSTSISICCALSKEIPEVKLEVPCLRQN